MFIGTELQGVIDALEVGEKYRSTDDKTFEIGVDVLPDFPKDTTDRNRTSPFAFTGNKFEFRMLGSADSISCTNTIINTIVAEELCQIADQLEGSADFTNDLKKLLAKIITEHKAIIYNGNGYSEEWLEEAVNVRHLPNLVSTVDALPEYITPKSVALFEKFKVYTEAELRARTEVLLENYSKVLNIEALTMLEIVKRDIIPACLKYTKEICDTGASKQAMGIDSGLEKELAGKLSDLTKGIYRETALLEEKVIAAQDKENGLPMARFYRDEVFAQMQTLRAIVDETETNFSEEYWPLPSYTKLLFTV